MTVKNKLGLLLDIIVLGLIGLATCIVYTLLCGMMEDQELDSKPLLSTNAPVTHRQVK